jgi:ribosomal protein L13E
MSARGFFHIPTAPLKERKRTKKKETAATIPFSLCETLIRPPSTYKKWPPTPHKQLSRGEFSVTNVRERLKRARTILHALPVGCTWDSSL